MENNILISFNQGPKVEIQGDIIKKYKIEFINEHTGKVEYSNTIKTNHWTKCSKRWHIPWTIKINGKIHHTWDIKNKNILISIESKSIGDTLAWVPQVARFADYYKCKVTLSTFHNHWFINRKEYKNIKFINPGQSIDCYASYQIGWYITDNKWDEGSYHPTKPNTVPLIQAASDILDIPFKEINYGINYKIKPRPFKEKYICIGPRSTAGLKEWPYDYWETLAGMLNNIGYKVVSISKEGFKKQNIINKEGMKWEDSINYLHHADLFIGLGSGLSWVNWCLGKYTVMINNFNPYGFDFTQNITQIQNHSVCNGCWADTRFQFDKGNWDWCPQHQGTLSEHICHKAISPEQVYKKIEYILRHKLN
jgi:autotransporter strand-loop-strand O-heptosyltransferase